MKLDKEIQELRALSIRLAQAADDLSTKLARLKPTTHPKPKFLKLHGREYTKALNEFGHVPRLSGGARFGDEFAPILEARDLLWNAYECEGCPTTPCTNGVMKVTFLVSSECECDNHEVCFYCWDCYQALMACYGPEEDVQ